MGTVLNFFGLSDLRDLAADPRPAWLWSDDGRTLIWCNAAGGSLLGLASAAKADGYRLSERSPTAGHIERFAKRSAAGREALELLRLQTGFRFKAIACLCKTVKLDDGARAVLAVATEADAKAPAEAPERLRAFAGFAGLSDRFAILSEGAVTVNPANVDEAALRQAASGGADGVVCIPGAGADPVLIAWADTPPVAAVETETGHAEPSESKTETKDAEAALAEETAVAETKKVETPADETAETTEPAGDAADATKPAAPHGGWSFRPATPRKTEETGKPGDAKAETPASEASGGETATSEAAETRTLSTETAETAENETATKAESGETTEPTPAETTAPEPTAIATDGKAETPARPKPRRATMKFVWRMDKDLCFSLVSPELGEAVGLAPDAIVGASWDETRETYGLDPENRVSAALDRRDTWSGITVDWPIADEKRRVPVDLSALPAFDRDRKFQGYRGFGICRMNDAFDDPGLDPEPGGKPPVDETTGETSGETADETSGETPETGSPAGATTASGGDGDRPAADGPTGSSEPGPGPAAPKGETETETGGAEIVSVSNRRAASANPSNVIPLRAASASADEDIVRLSKPEQEAFRQIARALGARIEDEAVETKPRQEPGGEPAGEQAQPTFNRRASDRPDGAQPEGDRPADETPEAETPKAEKTAPGRRERRDKAAAKAEIVPSAFAPGAAKVDKRLIDRLPIGVLVCRQNDILFANGTLLDMLDYGDLDELKAAGGLDELFVPQSDLADRPRDDRPSDRSLGLRRRDGDALAVDARMYRVPWNNGSALMITARETETAPAAVETNVSDVMASALNARKAAEDRSAELEAILETATDGVVVMDRDGTILTVNRSAEALFGAERDALVGKAITAFLAPESHRTLLDYLDGLANYGVASVLNDGREVIAQVDENAFLPLFVTIGRLGAGDGEKFCAVLRDITQWKKAEEELVNAKRQAEEANSQKSDFLARISHEIRTPLNAIIGFSEVMMEERFGEVGNAKYREYLADIHTSGAHIMSLINDLLDLSKIEAGKMEMSFEAVNLATVITECVALMQPQANRDRVIIRSSLPKIVPQVVADKRSIRQIILNLLSNAVKFNIAGGQVIISTSLDDSGEVSMRVRDTGVGMSERDVEAALEPFRQLHTARAGTMGSGLGLPLTKALVEANRATFRIESAPDEGTLVQITFPTTRVLAE